MKRILIVEDEERMRKLLISLLEAEGYRILEAENANQANELLKKEPIDLVLLDIKMAGADGGDLYEVIQLFHQKSKIIVTSVYPIETQKAIISEAHDYYDKSQSINLLLTKIERLLSA